MGSIDDAVDAAFEPLRGNARVDAAAAAVSNLADYGLIWVLLGLIKMRRKGPDRRRAVVALGAAGFSSLLVSRAAKASVERQRPGDHLDASVRTPTSSSFPSGHTLAAFCTAFLLADTDAQTMAQRRVRLGGGGQPGAPAGPPPDRCHRRRRHRLRARAGPAATG